MHAIERTEQWYTEAEVAALFRLDRRVLYRLRKQGEIGFIAVGRQVRYTERHIREYLERVERPAKAS